MTVTKELNSIKNHANRILDNVAKAQARLYPGVANNQITDRLSMIADLAELIIKIKEKVS